jgi:hypothetical protein
VHQINKAVLKTLSSLVAKLNSQMLKVWLIEKYYPTVGRGAERMVVWAWSNPWGFSVSSAANKKGKS